MFTISVGFLGTRFSGFRAWSTAGKDRLERKCGEGRCRLKRLGGVERPAEADLKIDGPWCRYVSLAWNADLGARNCAGHCSGSVAMPFPLIPAALVVCFLLVWALIGAMLFRDSRLGGHDDRSSDLNVFALRPASQPA